jgi:proteasome lid subunit RPN8/RPN11
MVKLDRQQIAQIFADAKRQDPSECCGLVGGSEEGRALSIYPLRNIARESQVAYEAAPEELFNAHREMRARQEQLLAIYHSHPRAREPFPSDTDVRLAYYPSITYLIVGLGDREPVLRAFEICEKELSWVSVEYEIVGE